MEPRRRWRAGYVVAAVLALVGAGGIALAPPASAAGTATLSLFKRIENGSTGASFGDRGAWDVRAVNVATGQAFQGQGLNGVQSITVPAGDYVISELENAATPDGYRFVNWDCGTLGTFTDPAPTISLAENANVTCTVENEAVPPTLTLLKEVDGGSASPSLWTLVAEGPNSIRGPSGVTGDARIGTYTLREEGGPSGYESAGWACVDESTGADVVVDQNSQIAVELGQDITCTVTNVGALPMLTLVKEVVGTGGPLDAATAWTLTADGPSGALSGTTGSTAVTHVGVEPGAFTLFENGPDGYTASDWECIDQAAGGAPVAVADAVVEVTGEADVQCTVVNTFAGAWLTLVKTVDGAASPTRWILGADSGSDSIVGRTGSAAVTRTPVSAGTYDLSETGPTVGWTTDGWQCTGSSDFVTSVTLNPGDDVTCSIENVSVEPHLTLVKTVVNAGGGPLDADDWTLTASGPVVASGVTGSDEVTDATVVPGDYILSEQSPAAEAEGYNAGAWSCVFTATGEPAELEGVVLTVPDTDESITCSIQNTWTGSTLTLQKQVITAFGDTAAPTEWVLTATGDSTFSGRMGEAAVTDHAIPAGSTWTLSEDGPSGYDPLGWSCTGATRVDDDTFTVAGGTDAVCRITNAAITPSLTLVKDLVSGGGGTATASDFLLKTRGPGNAAFAGTSGSAAVTGVFGPPGEYVFSESGPAGYDVSWNCTGTTFDSAAERMQLGYGDEAVCTATNTPIRPMLSLTKAVSGGVVDPDQWLLTAVLDGRTVLSGAGAVASTEVDAGVYTLAESGTGTGTPDYLPGDWLCTGDGFDADQLVQTGAGTAELTLPLGAEVDCTVVNAFTPPTLTLVKSVDDGPDGPGGAPENWVLTATGQGTATGTTVSGAGGVDSQVVTAGDYQLSEVPNASDPPPSDDYGATEWTCAGLGFTDDDLAGDLLTLGPGYDVTCTITNVYDPPRLTLVKEVDGGPLETSDWTLSWTDVDDSSHTGSGATGDAAVTDAPVEEGTFRLAESSTHPLAADYTASEWTCDGGEVAPPDVVALTADDVTVTCTVVNTYVTPTPTPSPSDSGDGGGEGDLPATGSDQGTVFALTALAVLALLVGAGVMTRARQP
ncbi:hypothetical protein ACFQRL_12235 [Microbacterium fluvii]|uniref:Gram-positive cocci surface proteins LPxTG domain-containing protein n=1 Tax=Microbacterium fluvii TaxID=415215 RepID=A0ABW2HIA6_9MICO|nr:hypothetical protein [Microbacterium fluvii]MCU4673365.1 hypothetical protein [Microbacterium fluvii]